MKTANQNMEIRKFKFTIVDKQTGKGWFGRTKYYFVLRTENRTNGAKDNVFTTEVSAEEYFTYNKNQIITHPCKFENGFWYLD